MPANNPQAYAQLNPISILTALTGRQGAPTLPEVNQVSLDELNRERQKALGTDADRAQAILAMIRSREVPGQAPAQMQSMQAPQQQQQSNGIQNLIDILLQRSPLQGQGFQ